MTKTGLFLKYLALLSAIALLPLWLLGRRLTADSQMALTTALLELQMVRAEAAASALDDCAPAVGQGHCLDRMRKFVRTGTFAVVNPEGRVIDIGAPTSLPGNVIEKLKGPSPPDTAGSWEFSDGGREMLGVRAPLSRADAAVIVVQTKKDAFRSVLFPRKRMSLLTIGLIFAVFTALLFVCRHLAGRLSAGYGG